MRKLIKFLWVYFIPWFVKNILKYLYIKIKFKNVIINYSTINNLKIDNIIELFTFWKEVNLGWDINILWKFEIWDYSYIGSWSLINGNNTFGLNIWKYCSIADNFYVISINNHYPSLLTTNDRILKAIWKTTRITWWDVNIWNDVWIWANVTILYWVKVGNWVVIGANSIITKDIPDYAIVVWNPWKVIKYRFTKEQIDFLFESKWWNLEKTQISKFYDRFNKRYGIDDSLFLK